MTYALPVSVTDSATATGYTISWGDGQTSTFGTNPSYPDGFPHLYSVDGVHTVTVAVGTGEGTFSQTAVISVETNEIYAWAAGPTGSGDEYVYHISYSGSGPVPTYTFNWGDGTATISNALTLTHEYQFQMFLPGDSATYVVNTYTGSFIVPENEITFAQTVGAVVYSSDGSGELSLSGAGGTAVGATYSLSATFTDDDQATLYYPGASEEYFVGGTAT